MATRKERERGREREREGEGGRERERERERDARVHVDDCLVLCCSHAVFCKEHFETLNMPYILANHTYTCPWYKSTLESLLTFQHDYRYRYARQINAFFILQKNIFIVIVVILIDIITITTFSMKCGDQNQTLDSHKHIWHNYSPLFYCYPWYIRYGFDRHVSFMVGNRNWDGEMIYQKTWRNMERRSTRSRNLANDELYPLTINLMQLDGIRFQHIVFFDQMGRLNSNYLGHRRRSCPLNRLPFTPSHKLVSVGFLLR